MLQLVIFSERPLKTHSFSSNTLEGHCEPGHAADRVIDLREVLRVSCCVTLRAPAIEQVSGEADTCCLVLSLMSCW